MTALALDPAALIECPKCIGAGRFDRFAHIANGDCFLCGSAKVVDRATASRWFASQVDRAPRREEPVGVQTRGEDGLARKTVVIPNLGKCRIVRYADGAMRIDLDEFAYRFDGERNVGGLWLVVVVEDGRVETAIDEDGGRLACFGLVCGTGELERHVLGCLQSALRR